jgi:SNF2 family DNA or RNA helicase
MESAAGSESIFASLGVPFAASGAAACAAASLEEPRDILIESRYDFALPAATAATIRFPFPPPRVTSYQFDPAAWGCLGGERAAQPGKGRAAGHPENTSRRAAPSRQPGTTRIRPPRDMVKLSDRLYCTLQPSLETLLTQATIDFPFAPFPHQFTGVAFLFPRNTAILADEMGLGKTMQTITSIRLLIHASRLQRVLLICPKPLVTNWDREFSTWAPELQTCVIEGNQSRREYAWSESAIPVKIANYELMTRDLEIIQDRQLLFDLVVIDEAQRIKNRHGATSIAVRAVPRRRSWALTGTPIENSTDDLVGIFEFLCSGYLREGMSPKTLRTHVRDHILRRTKTEVLRDLPPLLHRDKLLDLNDQQRATYEHAENEGVILLNRMGHGMTVQHVFELVLRLKQICNFDPVSGSSVKLERLQADLEEVIANGHKAIVFSQWVKTIRRLSEALPETNPLEYHGKIPSSRRDAVLSEFRENPKRHVLIMSYGAGSVGLNLQFCRDVFLFDQWWNPAVEDQAINRAHRIGSTGSVTVSRMITQNTIEERINEVLRSKRELFEQILSGTDQPAKAGLSREEIFGLFDLRAGGKPLSSVA